MVFVFFNQVEHITPMGDAVLRLAKDLYAALEALARDSSVSPQHASILSDLRDQLTSLSAARPDGHGPSPPPASLSSTSDSSRSPPAMNSSSSSSSRLLSNVPDALVLHSLSFLDVPSLLSLMSTSSVCRSLATSTQIWRPISLCRWPWLASHPQLPTHTPSPKGGEPYWELFRRRMQASHEARAYRPVAQTRFRDYDLCVDLRHQDGEILYSARGPLGDTFAVDIFDFQGWVLCPQALVVNRPLLFSSWSEVEAFFGDEGPLRLEFTVVDRVRRCMADLSSPSTRPRFTRCRRGWDAEGQGRDQELWLFACPDATFLSGALRILRGLTISVVEEEQPRGTEEGGEGGSSRSSVVVCCRVQSAWVCDHQYLDYTDRPVGVAEVQQVFSGELRWV